MAKRVTRRLWLMAALLLMPAILAGCLERVGPTPDRLTFNLPTTLTIERGATLLNTDILYESSTDDGVYLLLGGQRALRRRGDSVRWEGSPVPGADVRLDLRVIGHTEDQVQLAGTAVVIVRHLTPQSDVIDTSSPMSFSGPVAYGIAVGSHIPGTTLTYLGETEQGAELGGLYSEYPYRRIGDSIVWEGRLRDSIYLRLELRTVHFDRRGLRVAGIGTLWLAQ